MQHLQSALSQHLSQARRDQAMKQRVLITGGAHGIGKASAQRCIAEGYEVLIIDQTGDGIRADLSCPDQTAEAPIYPAPIKQPRRLKKHSKQARLRACSITWAPLKRRRLRIKP